MEEQNQAQPIEQPDTLKKKGGAKEIIYIILGVLFIIVGYVFISSPGGNFILGSDTGMAGIVFVPIGFIILVIGIILLAVPLISRIKKGSGMDDKKLNVKPYRIIILTVFIIVVGLLLLLLF